MKLRFGICDLGFVIKTIPALILSISFSGCLFLRPYTPSARLVPENTISTAYAAGVNNYSQNVETGVYDYMSGTYSNYTSHVSSGSAPFADIGARTRIPGSDVDIGLNLSSFCGLALDAKFALTRPGQGLPLLALDASVFINGIQSFNAGYSAGPVLNVPFLRDGIFDLVLAAYYQNYSYKEFGFYYTGSDNNYSQSYAVAPPKNSFYLYAGLELAFDNGTVIAPGVSYTYFMGPYDQPQLISAGVTVKTGAVRAKEQKAAVESSIAPPLLETASYINSAKRMIENGDINGASAALADGLDVYPGDYSLSLMQGFCMAKLGKKRLAYKYYSDALVLDPDNIRLKQSVRDLWEEIKKK